MSGAVAIRPRIYLGSAAGRLGWLGRVSLITAALVLAPIVAVVWNVFLPSETTWSHLASTVLPSYIWNTLLLLIMVALGVISCGVVSAWLVSAYSFPGKHILEWALVLPMAMPAYVMAYAYTDWLQAAGPVQTALRALTGLQVREYWFPDIRSLPGAAAMFSFALYPYVYLLARAAFLDQPRSFIEVGHLAGYGPWGGFWRVALPLARPGIAAGTALALMETLADFGTVSYFAVNTFTTGIYRAWLSLGDPVAAGQLATCLLVFVFAILAVERRHRGSARYAGKRIPVAAQKLRGWRSLAAATVCAAPVLFGFLLPVGILLELAANEPQARFGARILALVSNTFTLAGVAALTAVMVALLLAYAARSVRSPLVQGANRLAVLGYALPGAVLAVGILLPLGKIDNAIATWMQEQFGLRTGLFLTGSIVALVYAYLVRFLAVAFQTVEAGLTRVTPSLDDAARSLGLSPARTLARVHIPMISGSVGTAAMLVFVDVMKELPATFAMRPFNFDTLAVEAYNLAKDERIAEAAVPALLMIGTALLPLILLSRQIARSSLGRNKQAAQPPRLGSFLKSMATRVLLGVILGLLTTGSVWAAPDDSKRLLALIDYIGSDYRNAVQDGKIVNTDEYQEMTEFSARSLELFGQLKSQEGVDKAGIEKELRTLVSHIQQKSAAEIVADMARQIKERLIATYGIVTHPRTLPSLEAGKRVYRENCAQCHGETGKGDGPSVSTMQPRVPRPANFLDPELMSGLSPFKAFNTTSFGVQGTAMPSFSAVSEEDRWAAAFYVFSLRFSPMPSAAGKELFKSSKLPEPLARVDTLAALTDGDLSNTLEDSFSNKDDAEQVLAYLRKGVLEKRMSDPLLVARAYLEQSLSLYEQGKRQEAYQRAVDAYLDGFELAEPALTARDNSFARAVEGRFTQFRNAVKQGASPAEIRAAAHELDGKLQQAERLLSENGRGFSATYAFVNSALIILREGLEAALIIAAILTVLRVTGERGVARYIHIGWLLAIGSGILTWILAETVVTLSGRHRESMEGFISIAAAVALFYVGYWLHTHAEVRKWRAFIDERVREITSSKRVWGLVGISFFAVYREAFEVVLFYQALWLQNQNNRASIASGLIAGACVLVGLTFAVFKLGLRLPIKYFFGATGTLLYLLAFVFAGSGIRELQAAGWVPSTPLGFPPQFPVLGIYPTVETLAAQLAMLAAFVRSSLWMIRGNDKPSVRTKNP